MRAEEGPMDTVGFLLESIRVVHKRDTCDEAGRPLGIYMCEYHQGFEDGMDTLVERGWKDASW